MAANSEQTLDNIIKNNLNGQSLKEFNRIYYGREDHAELTLQKETLLRSNQQQLQVSAYAFHASREQERKPRIVKIGLIQHSIVLPTSEPIRKQREAIFNKVRNIIEIAVCEGVNIICLQETWSMPFFLGTQQKTPWEEFTESAENGPSIIFLSELAKLYEIVIVSPILEKDNNGTWWNTAVVINEKGDVLGKHRKNHLPSVGRYNETNFYNPGNTGHPVFETKFAKIAINICYGRHHALNWMMFAVNGAEIVFNPAATISEFGEAFWRIEARNAAIANNYFTCSINRVGTEEFTVKTTADSDDTSKVTRTYYGSSYITAPDGCMTPCLSTKEDGLLIGELDLNLCRQKKDQWGFNITNRLNMYAEKLNVLNQNK